MYELIEHRVLSTNASSITFSNIPQTYTDLYLVVSARSTRTDQGPRSVLAVQFNGVTTGYSYRRLFGIPTLATGSDNGSGADSFLLGYQSSNATTANTFGNASLYLPNYTSNQNKSGNSESVGEGNESPVGLAIQSNLWSNTAAITSLTIYDPSYNLMQNSSATLYGVNRTQFLGRPSQPKAIGGNITFANGYWVHTFTGSGSLIVNQDITAEYLVVAGGGGTTHGLGGGAGAGGYRSSVQGEFSGGGATAETPMFLSKNQTYAVTVGAGGAGNQGSNQNFGGQGSDSVFGAITSLGGGRGTAQSINYPSVPSGQAGGSGSGGVRNANAGGSGTANQGYAGGSGSNSANGYGGGGGGGAGSIGANGNGTSGGNGGSGVTSSITGTAVARAGGGGGAVGDGTRGVGTAGGGSGGTDTGISGTDGTPNTGGGGGGGSSVSGLGRSGGSGVVIIRYRAD